MLRLALGDARGLLPGSLTKLLAFCSGSYTRHAWNAYAVLVVACGTWPDARSSEPKEDDVDHDEVSPAGVQYASPNPAPTDRGLLPLTRLCQTAQHEIDRHVKADGRCALCRTPFPCERATLAEMALASF